MIKTQIQLPDKLYHEVKRFAAEREWSLAETFRRGAERLISLYPTETDPDWALPPAKNRGPFLAPPQRWTEMAHEDL